MKKLDGIGWLEKKKQMKKLDGIDWLVIQG